MGIFVFSLTFGERWGVVAKVFIKGRIWRRVGGLFYKLGDIWRHFCTNIEVGASSGISEENSTTGKRTLRVECRNWFYTHYSKVKTNDCLSNENS